jgi:hypothetical protein
MPTFIDESGETGAVSPYFRLAAVWLPTQKAAENFRAGIQAFQQQEGLTGYEYKFSKTTQPDRRTAYFREVTKHPFRFHVACVDKKHPQWRAAGGSVIHWACAVSLAGSLRSVYLQEELRQAAEGGTNRPLAELVIVDDNQDGDYLNIIKQKFRELDSGVRPGGALVGKVKFRGSGPDELLQLADMVCGAVGTYIDGDPQWYNMISAHALGRSDGITRIP